MKATKIIGLTVAACSLFYVLTTSCSPLAQEKDPQDLHKSCQEFVQEFYDWYAERAFASPAGWSVVTLKDKGSEFQKALTQMNLQLANVLSDISGVTGQAIIKAILAGERNPHKLAEFRDPRVKASKEQIA